MKTVKHVLMVVTLCVCVNSAFGAEEPQKKVWKGALGDRTVITKEDIAKILKNHEKWLETEGRKGQRANLILANLVGVDLIEAKLIGATLVGADLSRAKLGKALLIEADLRGTLLIEADLCGADLSRAKLIGANLMGADLNKTTAYFADFNDSFFQPENIEYFKFLGTKGFSTIDFDDLYPVVKLRKIAKESGLRSEERALTATLRKYRLRGLSTYERIFEYIFLDLPTGSGANPWRSLEVLVGFILFFSIPYIVALRRHGKDGIWKLWIKERVRKDLGEEKPARLTLHGFTGFKIGFYFSVLSAFSIGWRELNVGNWISRVQPREYTLRATGWVRTVSGIQSLLSVYLIALWVLTYFGRPFE